MSPTKPTDLTVTADRPFHTTQPAVEFDAAHIAWVAFDQRIDAGIAAHEDLLAHYLTRRAVRVSLGR